MRPARRRSAALDDADARQRGAARDGGRRQLSRRSPARVQPTRRSSFSTINGVNVRSTRDDRGPARPSCRPATTCCSSDSSTSAPASVVRLQRRPAWSCSAPNTAVPGDAVHGPRGAGHDVVDPRAAAAPASTSTAPAVARATVDRRRRTGDDHASGDATVTLPTAGPAVLQRESTRRRRARRGHGLCDHRRRRRLRDDDPAAAAAADPGRARGRRPTQHARHDGAGRDDRVDRQRQDVRQGPRPADAVRARPTIPARGSITSRCGSCATSTGHCSTFLPSKAKFAGIRCGAVQRRLVQGRLQADWSYLLPAALPSGRYSLDVRVTDRAHNYSTALDGGKEHVTFTVADPMTRRAPHPAARRRPRSAAGCGVGAGDTPGDPARCSSRATSAPKVLVLATGTRRSRAPTP